MKVPLTKILQELIVTSCKADPFNDEFSEDEFIALFNNSIEEYAKSFEISNKEQYPTQVKIILTLNSYYEGLMLRIEDLINQINIDEQFLVDLIFSITNFDYYAIQIEKQKYSSTETVRYPQNLEEIHEIKVPNIFGDEINSHEVIDASVDICIELISIIKSFEPKQDKELPILNQNDVYKFARELLIVTNLLVNLKTGFDTFKFELGEILEDSGSIKIKYHPEHYYLLKQAGKQRKANHIHEYLQLTLLNNKPFKTFTHQPPYDSLLKINSGRKREVNDITALSEASFLSYYFHLLDKNPIYQGIKIRDIFDFISNIKIIFKSINIETIINDCRLKQDFSSVPIKILKSDLLEKLKEVLKLNTKGILRLLKIISKPLTHYSNFWAHPLAENGAYYYFLAAPIVDGHFEYIIDNIFDELSSIKESEKKFKQLIATELPNNIYDKYEFQNINPSKFDQSLSYNKNLLIYETKENIIVLNINLYKFPIDSKEYSDVFNQLSKAALILEGSVKVIEKNQIKMSSPKKIIGAIITNYTSHSGIIINKIPILDYTLLKNYLSVGEHKRGMLVLSENNIRAEELASYKYYESEKEFNDNLLKFLYNPDPILEAIEFYKITECPLLLKEMSPQVYTSGIETKDTQSILLKKVNKLKYYLKQLFYFESSLGKDEYSDTIENIERQILFILPQAFNMASLEGTDRSFRDELLNLFKNVGNVGLSYLIFSLQNSLSKISTKKTTNPKENKTEYPAFETNFEDGTEMLKQIFKENLNSRTHIRLSELNLNHSLSSRDLSFLIQYLTKLLSSLTPRPYTEDELNEYLLIITVYLALNKENKYDTQTILLNFVDVLNFNFQYQKARNFCEEVLIFFTNKEEHPLTGWLCLYKCFLRQGNVYDASFYGILLYSSIDILPEIEEELFVDLLYNSMLFFRNFGHSGLESTIFKILKNLKLSDYDEQKIILSYYNGILQHDIDKITSLLPEIEEYLAKNISHIVKYNSLSTIPWVAFIYNLKNIHSAVPINNFAFFEEKLSYLESFINEDTLDNLKQQYFPISEKTSILFRNSLVKIFETNNFEDLSYEFENLLLIAKNVAQLSIEQLNLRDLLLTGLVFNDQSLTFKPRKNLEVARFLQEPDNELIKRIDNYSDYLLNKISLRDGQLICWIFNINSEVYLLRINANKHYTLEQQTSWSIREMNNWLSSLTEFYFDDKGDFPINEQENEYISILKKLSFSQLNLTEPCDEILLLTSVNLAGFPHNLIKMYANAETINYKTHEYVVRNYIDSFNTDLISFHKPIVNIISLEWFAENGQEIILSMSDLTIESWIPVADEDTSIYIGYNRLKPIIEEKYGGKIYTEIIPSHKLSSSINVFMAHGGKGIEGFRTVYTKNTEGHAIVRERGIEKIFGNGVIAVVFVCNSAYMTKELYSQRLSSFVHHILSLGYKTVVAPAWSLNPEISSTWLDSFVQSLKSGKTVSFATQIANHAVANKGYNEYHGFYTPSGWAAMHVYGNPNVLFE